MAHSESPRADVSSRLACMQPMARPRGHCSRHSPPIYPEWLGDRSFCEIHGVRFPYCTGAMANGIASTRLVIAMARAGFLGFFGAAGLGPATVEQALFELER